MTSDDEIYKIICNEINECKLSGFQFIDLTFPYHLTENIIDLLKQQGITTNLTYYWPSARSRVEYAFTWVDSDLLEEKQENPVKKEIFGDKMIEIVINTQKKLLKHEVKEMANRGRISSGSSRSYLPEVIEWAKAQNIYVENVGAGSKISLFPFE